MTRAEALRYRQRIETAVQSLPDSEALEVVTLYPAWAAGIAVTAGKRYQYADKLYKVRDGKSHTTQEDWTPDVTPDLWAVVDETHAGTIDDPIPAARGMEYEYSKYYLDGEDSKIYLCQRTGEAAGGTIVLQYMPHELVGQYFELAN